jgi:hypothetical protein
MIARILTSIILLAVPLQCFFEVILGASPLDHSVAVWIESPKQNERIYYYLSEDPVFNATIRLLRRPSTTIGALSLNVFFQGSLVAQVAAESDTVLTSQSNVGIWNARYFLNKHSRFRSRSQHMTSMLPSRYHPFFAYENS